MKLDELIEIGMVAKPWGTKGEVKIRVTTDVPGRFDDLPGVYLHDNRFEPEYFKIESVKNLNDAVAVKLDGIDTASEAERLRNMEVSVPESERAPLGEDEYYIYELIGLQVFDREEKQIGTLVKVYQGAAHDILLVETEKGSVMVPAVPEYIHDVDLTGGRLVISLPVHPEE
jgi:16S rRNA processing protein RimM